jgi:predicted flap endonuclease-1-like 5' DNA nuclease
MRTRGFLAVLVLLSLFGAVGAAQASHYPLDAAGFLSDGERTALLAQGIEDTAQLLAATDTPAERGALAGTSGIDKKRLREIQEVCDLLQVRGIGPKMAGVLRLAGVYDTRALAGEKADPLALKMKKANDVHKVSEILPESSVLEGWIQQAATFSRRPR